MQTIQPRHPARQAARYSRWGLALIVVLVLGNAAALWLLSTTPLIRDAAYPADAAAATWRVGIADLGEQPHLIPDPPESPVLFCDGVSISDQGAITDGVALLRATDSGAALYDLLEREGICIGVGDLDFNSAFARSRWSPTAGWSESEIVLGEQYVDWLYPDVIAAILAHEATHIERAVTRTACYYANACTTLPNGVELEEEIVAHQAEAEWWIAAYGKDGKDRAFTVDVSENRLKAAYLQGPDAFRSFIREMRSDEREGEGI